MPNQNTKTTMINADESRALSVSSTNTLHPAIVSGLMLENRENWDQERYVFAIKNALHVKGLSQWCIGLFTYETLQKWPNLTYKDVAKSLNLKSETLEMYTRVYSYYAKYQADFTPPSEYSFEFLRAVATASKKFKKNPIKELERLASIGIVRNANLAYENIRWTVPPKEWLKPMPKIVFKWNKDKTQQIARIVGKKELIHPFILCLDWEDFERQYFEMTGIVSEDLLKFIKLVKAERLRLRIDKPENII